MHKSETSDHVRHLGYELTRWNEVSFILVDFFGASLAE